MSARDYSRLAAIIFAIVSLLQLVRAVSGWPITIGALQSRWGQVGWSALLQPYLLGSGSTRLGTEIFSIRAGEAARVSIRGLMTPTLAWRNVR